MARAHNQTVVAIRFAATGADDTAQNATIKPRSRPIAAYAPAVTWGVRVSGRTAERAGRAISATVTRAPRAAQAARAKRQGPLERGPGPPRTRLPITAPKT